MFERGWPREAGVCHDIFDVVHFFFFNLVSACVLRAFVASITPQAHLPHQHPHLLFPSPFTSSPTNQTASNNVHMNVSLPPHCALCRHPPPPSPRNDVPSIFILLGQNPKVLRQPGCIPRAPAQGCVTNEQLTIASVIISLSFPTPVEINKAHDYASVSVLGAPVLL